MNSDSESTFVKVLVTDSLTDIALIKSVLDAEGVRYFLQGENMMYFADPAILMVVEEDVEKAAELLRPLKLKFTRMGKL